MEEKVLARKGKRVVTGHVRCGRGKVKVTIE